MALIVEDGSIVAGANTYVNVADVRTYATARGIVLPVDDTAVEVLIIIAMDYLNGLSYKGEQVEPDVQSLPFPRKGIFIGTRELPDDEIPPQLIRAECQLVVEQQKGIDLFPSRVGRDFVKRKKIGPIETEYSESVYLSNGDGPDIPLVDGLLSSLIAPGGGFGNLRVVRV